MYRRKQPARGLGGTLSSLRQETGLKTNIFTYKLCSYFGIYSLYLVIFKRCTEKTRGKQRDKDHRSFRTQHKTPAPHFLIKREMPFSKVLSKSRGRGMLRHQEIWILVDTSAPILFKKQSEATFCIFKF